MQTRTSLDGFERYLERAIDRLEDSSPNRALIREHFALDDPNAKRGKRLRPRILIAAAQTEGAPAQSAFSAAAAVELLHNFSLVHDDIEDRDTLRHGRPALWSTYGDAAAITAGDAMCALSYLTLLRETTGAAEAVVAMTACLHRGHLEMCRGQGLDIGFETAATVTFAEYLKMIEGKTAALFGASCELGALAAGAPAGRSAAYGRMGRAYGLAFQIRDDILGSWGSPAETGKPAGADIRRRKWSFPVAWALNGPPSPDRETIAGAYHAIGELDDARADRVLDALERLGAHRAADDACDAAIADAVEIAAQHGLDADGKLAALFASTARRTA
ncbi:MAG: polyprenyl synthetase family protein [Candidatus Elarobacter sp.]